MEEIGRLACENNGSSDVPQMSMESVGNIDFFKCNKCPYMALTAKDIQFHWQTSHSKSYKITDTKSITVKCPGCSGIFYSEVSLKTHLRSHHKMCVRDVNKLVQNLINQFKRNQEYIENMEVIIDGHTNKDDLPLLIEIPADPNQVVIVNNNPPINVINIGGTTTNYILNSNNEVDNSQSFILNKNISFHTKNIEALVASPAFKQSILKNKAPKILSPPVRTFSKTDGLLDSANYSETSILYNKLSASNVSSIKTSLPAVQQNILNLSDAFESNCGNVKNTVHIKNHSTQYENLSYSVIGNGTSLKIRNEMAASSIDAFHQISSNNNYVNINYQAVENNHTKSNLAKDSTELKPSDKADPVIRKVNIKTRSNSSVSKTKPKTTNRLKNNRYRENVCGVAECSISLMSEDNLKYHRKCHVNETKHLCCPECKMSNFSSVSPLHNHLWKIHNIDLDLFTCDICQHKTFDKKQLSYHILIHSKVKKYQCTLCSKSFKNSKQLSTHRSIHKKDTQSMNYICNVCNVSLSSARQLYLHKMAVHEKKKSFQCDHCEYTCATKHSLQLHIIRHIGTKHLKCSYCQFKTGDRNVLRRHTQRHTSQKTYSCKHCSYSCIQASSFKTHLTSKHADKRDKSLFTCTECQFSTISQQKHSAHVLGHREGTLKLSKSKSVSNNKNKKCSKSKTENQLVNTLNDTSIAEVIDPDVIHVTDHNSSLTPQIVSIENASALQNDVNFIESNIVNFNQIIHKDPSNFFSNSINPSTNTSGVDNVAAYYSNTIHGTLFDSVNKNENMLDVETTSASLSSLGNGNDVRFNSNDTQYNSVFHTEDYQNNIDTDDNETYFSNYEPNLVINEEIQPSSENTCNVNNAYGTGNECFQNSTENQSVNMELGNTNNNNKPENVRMTSNIFVKDILDLAASHIKTIPPNIYASDIQKSASHTPIILINPKTQTNNRILGANVFSSNIINSCYSDDSHASVNNLVPRKKPKISVKSNLILKGPDKFDNFDVHNNCDGKSNEFNMNTPPFQMDSFNLSLDFLNNVQSNENNNINITCGSDLISNDLYNSEHNYLSNYLLNSDYPLPNIQAPIVSTNDSTMMQDNLNPIETLSLDTNLTDMSDVKLENKPYFSNQSETVMPNLVTKNVHNNPNFYFNVPIHVPIKFEQKMDSLSSFSSQNNPEFEDDFITSSINNSVVTEDAAQTFDCMNSSYNQSLYPFEDNYYFENDFVTETLDGQEIIVLDDTCSDVKSMPNSSTHQFNQNTRLSVNVNETAVKEKPRIISEVHIAGNNASNFLSTFGEVKRIGLPLNTLTKNTINDTGTTGRQQNGIFNLEEQGSYQ